MCGIDPSNPSSHPAATPLGLWGYSSALPRVARSSQPWAGGRNPFGIGWQATACRQLQIHSSLNKPRISKVSNSRPLGWRSCVQLWGSSPDANVPITGNLPPAFDGFQSEISNTNTLAFKNAGDSSPISPIVIPSPRIPTGFRPPAQGCEERATLGYPPISVTTPTGLRPFPMSAWISPHFRKSPTSRPQPPAREAS